MIRTGSILRARRIGTALATAPRSRKPTMPLPRRCAGPSPRCRTAGTGGRGQRATRDHPDDRADQHEGQRAVDDQSGHVPSRRTERQPDADLPGPAPDEEREQSVQGDRGEDDGRAGKHRHEAHREPLCDARLPEQRRHCLDAAKAKAQARRPSLPQVVHQRERRDPAAHNEGDRRVWPLPVRDVHHRADTLVRIGERPVAHIADDADDGQPIRGAELHATANRIASRARSAPPRSG